MAIPEGTETVTRTVLVPLDITLDVANDQVQRLLGLDQHRQDHVVVESAVALLAKLFGVHNRHAVQSAIDFHLDPATGAVQVCAIHQTLDLDLDLGQPVAFEPTDPDHPSA